MLRRVLVAAALCALAAVSNAASAGAVGFQYASAPDADDQPIDLAIWYPSDAPVSSQPVGLFTQAVAPYSPVKGDGLPLVVISHGTGGSGSGHYDTALALADAGFVVVAMSHTGDNYKDRAYSFTARNFTDRPRHISRVLDFMLDLWDGHDHLNPGRIGIFGHSAGGATALIAIGGNPVMYLNVLFCRDHSDDWGCQQAKKDTDANLKKPVDREAPDWQHDPRLKAAAIAAPAIGYTFTKVGLENITAPVQLWRAENDKIAPNTWNADIIKDSLPKPPDDHLVKQAGHFDFLAPCNDALVAIAPEICSSAPGFDRTAFHKDMNQALVSFFKAQLPAP